MFHGFEGYGDTRGIDLEIEYRPISSLRLSLYPEFMHRNRVLQYVDQVETGTENRYIFGSIDQKTFSLSFRVDLIITPELTIQFWGQPFIAAGDYSGFKYIIDPGAATFSDRYRLYGMEESALDQEQQLYTVTEAESGLSYQFENPDFNVKEFLANLVFRWEYRPGSFLYLVWSQSREREDPAGHFSFGHDFADIWDIHPGDVVMLKVSYRLGR
jgi:hypothetical protein